MLKAILVEDSLEAEEKLRFLLTKYCVARNRKDDFLEQFSKF